MPHPHTFQIAYKGHIGKGGSILIVMSQNLSTPSSQETRNLAQKSTERLLHVHRSLSTSPFYLSNEAVVDHVQWVRDGRAN